MGEHLVQEPFYLLVVAVEFLDRVLEFHGLVVAVHLDDRDGRVRERHGSPPLADAESAITAEQGPDRNQVALGSGDQDNCTRSRQRHRA